MTDRRIPASRLTAAAATALRLRRRRQGGFNFSEVLFAVMILGIGFIMIAAIFPVALQQTKQTGEEVNAASSGRSGVNFIQQVGSVAKNLPVTWSRQMLQPNASVTLPGAVYSFNDPRIAYGPDQTPPVGQPFTPANDPDLKQTSDGPATADGVRTRLWNEIAGKLILPSDNRLAWVAFYRRGATFTNSDNVLHEQDYFPLPATMPPTPANPLPPNPVSTFAAPYAEVIVLAVEVRNRSIYEPAKDIQHYVNAPATLEPRMVYVKLAEGNGSADQLQFYDGATAGAQPIPEPAAGEGAFVIISDDQLNNNGALNGRIYRLGTQRPDLAAGRYELAPGWDMTYLPITGYNENIPAGPLATPNNPTVGGTPAVAFIVGKGYTDPTNPYVNAGTPGAGFEGAVQDIAVYTSIVPAN